MEFKGRLAKKLAKELGMLKEAEYEALLEVPPDDALGDYALPCFPFAKSLKKAPPLIAQELATKVKRDELLAETKAVGPYLNLFLDRELVAKETLSAILKERERYGAGKGTERVMIEYSQPNTHKAFHVGHLRGTSIGESLARILRHAGHEVVQANYSGDTGMHVAKWLWCYTTFHEGERPPKEQPGKWLAAIYVEAVQKLEREPAREEEVRALNKRLDEGKDAQLIALWKETRQWSIDEFNEIYKELGAHFDYWFWEREMENRAKEAARELLKRGIAQESDGALIIDFEKEGKGVWVLLRDDGTPLYSAKDIALAEEKFKKYRITRSIYVVGKAQALHLEQLFLALRRMEYEHAEKCFHLSYEEVRLPEGKMSSRTGQNILYSDLREEVFGHTEEEIRKRHEEWDEKQVAAVVEAVGVCALKFEMLYRDHNKPIVFDAGKVCDFEGDTGPYIQYTHTRCNSILKRLAKRPSLQKAAFGALATDHERRLVRQLGLFPEAIGTVDRTLYPEHLAKYALELAKTFNRFYHECRVLGEEPEVENARALLVEATRTVLELGLQLLGIAAPEQM